MGGWVGSRAYQKGLCSMELAKDVSRQAGRQAEVVFVIKIFTGYCIKELTLCLWKRSTLLLNHDSQWERKFASPTAIFIDW
jgi:hypothetical protein